jgi:hypothetical protein
MGRDNFIVCRPRLVLRQILEPLLGNDGSLVIGAGESANRVDRIPENDRDEFDLVADFSS